MSIFQKIIDGDVPAYRIYEDDTILAFLDIHPATPGHILVIPKKAAEFVWDLTDETYQALMSVTKKLALHLREQLPQQYVHMSIVGTDVPHAHVHLIPFDTTADFHNPERMDGEPDHQALAAMQKKLRLT